MSSKAQAACSRLDPQPKLSPAMRIGAAANSGSEKMFPGSFLTASKAPRPRPSRVTVLSQWAGMMTSVSTFLRPNRSEEHTSELQSLMRISYAVFCLKKKNTYKQLNIHNTTSNHL